MVDTTAPVITLRTDPDAYTVPNQVYIEEGYSAVDAKTADEVYENVIKGIGTKKRAIVLQHDPHGFSVDAVERIIIWGLENGYSFRELTPDSPGFHQYVNN